MSATNKTFEPLPGRFTTMTDGQEALLKKAWLNFLQFTGHITSLEKVNDTVTYADKATHQHTEVVRQRSKASDINVADTPEMISLRNSLKGMSAEELDKLFRNFCKLDSPDNEMLRFLRARKWDVSKGLGMLGHTMLWRKTHKIDRLVSRNELLGYEENDDGLLRQLRRGKTQLRGEDKLGRPIVYVGVHLHKPRDQSTESLDRFTVLACENTRLLMRKGIDQALVIFDLSRFGISNMDYHAVKYMADCFEAHYPESLGVVLIHRAPWVFSSIWKVIKNWFDPVVASKIQFTTKDEDLLNFIEPEHVDKELSGKREWKFDYIEPKPEDNERLKDDETKQKLLDEREALFDSFYDATLNWCKSSGDESKGWYKRKLELAEALRSNFWHLDPYVRASCVEDRNGTVVYFQDKVADRNERHSPLGDVDTLADKFDIDLGSKTETPLPAVGIAKS